MRLRDLDARFIYEASRRGFMQSDSDSPDGMQGIVFQCPKCSQGLERGEENGRGFAKGAHYVEVFFSNPRGGAVAGPECDPHNKKHPRWQMSGTSIDDLTLSPSVNLDIPGDDGIVHGCRWHGFVTNGDAS